MNTHEMNPGAWMRAVRARQHALAREYYHGLDATAREGISDEDYATTMTTLETMARNLGWDESQGMPGARPFGPLRGWHGWRGRGHHRHHHRSHQHQERGEHHAEQSEKHADV